EEGVRGKRAKDWRLVDEVIPNSRFDETVAQRARDFAAASNKPGGEGITLRPLNRTFGEDGSVVYSLIEVAIDRDGRKATIAISGPDGVPPASAETLQALGDQSYLLRLARELDDAILHLRFNELDLGLLTFKSQGDAKAVLAEETVLLDHQDHWLAKEILLCWKRVLKRIDVTSRSLVALVEHGSCFAGVLADILFAVDRSYMMSDEFEGDNRPLAAITLSASNFGAFPMANGLTRLDTRFLGEPGHVESVKDKVGKTLQADEAGELALVTFAYDDIDWEDEIRIFMEERASFSPDAVTGMEANLRFPGPETMETRIFGRLTAWQNWIFNRPNATGEDGALRRYGTGRRGDFDMERV
ncbi:MAG: 2,3-epoxybenzoyl-CoA dihydrolase, partial [Geminicoccaceae bacterium]